LNQQRTKDEASFKRHAVYSNVGGHNFKRASHMIKILTGIIFLFSTFAFAERIHGPANVRQEIKGEIAFSLNDNVEIDIGELKDDWYEVVVSLTLTERQFESDIIKKGEKLYNGKGEEIGVALKDLSLSSKYSGGGAPGVPKWYGVDIYGYTFKGNIRPESIIEPAISKLIESNRQNLTIMIFKEHMDYFGYVDGLKIKDMDKYETYMIYESILDDISPLDRVRLIFEDEELIAIVHSRNLTITNFETVLIERGRKLTLIKNLSTQDKKTFIEKNNQTYWGID
jgi:hypothetical protein